MCCVMWEGCVVLRIDYIKNLDSCAANSYNDRFEIIWI